MNDAGLSGKVRGFDREPTAGDLGLCGGPDEYRSGPGSSVTAALDAATEQREATPGRPEDGPYPASVVELADEVARWINQAATYAPGLAPLVVEALVARSEPCDCPRRTVGGPVTGRRLPDNDWVPEPSAGPVQTGWSGQ